MSLDVINAQGAQVTALRNQVTEQQVIIAMLASRLGYKTHRFTKKQRQQTQDDIDSVVWRELKDGTLVVIAKRKKGNK